MNNSYDCLKGARSYFSKFCCLFHLKNHHSKDVNLKFQLKRSSRLDLQSKRNLLSMFANCKPFIREIFQLSYMDKFFLWGVWTCMWKSIRIGLLQWFMIKTVLIVNHLRVVRCLISDACARRTIVPRRWWQLEKGWRPLCKSWLSLCVIRASVSLC